MVNQAENQYIILHVIVYNLIVHFYMRTFAGSLGAAIGRPDNTNAQATKPGNTAARARERHEYVSRHPIPGGNAAYDPCYENKQSR